MKLRNIPRRGRRRCRPRHHGALVLPAVASAHSATHTLKFTAVQKGTVNFGKTAGANQETDLNAAGKTIGFDMIYFAATSKTSGAVNITVDTSGGFLYGTATVSTKTGGTGSFDGATGTIKAKAISSNKHAVTITYSG
jgi:hypothetical protein